MKLRYLMPLAFGLALLTLPLTTGRAAGGPLHVDLTEWSINPAATVVPAGDVTFEVTTPATAAKTHEMQVIRSDLPIDALPMTPEGDVDEDKVGSRVGLIEQVRPGDVDSATFTLAPGRYVLLCNLAEHYVKGMVTEIQVQ